MVLDPYKKHGVWPLQAFENRPCAWWQWQETLFSSYWLDMHHYPIKKCIRELLQPNQPIPLLNVHNGLLTPTDFWLRTMEVYQMLPGQIYSILSLNNFCEQIEVSFHPEKKTWVWLWLWLWLWWSVGVYECMRVQVACACSQCACVWTYVKGVQCAWAPTCMQLLKCVWTKAKLRNW